MIKIAKITNPAHKWNVISDLYFQDPDFVDRHHIKKGNLIDCVNHTINNISPESDFFQISFKYKPIGFFAINTKCSPFNVLEGFHVLPEFRTAGIFSEFWNLVKGSMNGRLTAIGIYKENAPAIRHLEFNGFKNIGTHEITGSDYCFLIFIPK